MKRLILIFAFALLLTLPCAAAAEDEETVTIPVIMYHHIHESPDKCGKYVVSPKTLEGDLEYLSMHGYTAVDSRDLVRWLDGEAELPEKPVVITFDDGQESFARYALPLLEKYGMKAIAAVVGEYADEYTENHDTDVNYAYMSWERIAEAARSGCAEIACHTYAMHDTSPRMGCGRKKGEDAQSYRRAFSRDLDMAEERLAAALGETSRVFMYPFGTVCPEAREILAERGYRVLFTCEERVNTVKRGAAQPIELGRFNRANGMGCEAFFAQFN